jgi:hypothetical protein
MKILVRNKISPIYMSPGDTLVLSYRDPNGGETVACSRSFTRSMRIDEAMIFELTQKELKKLGLKDAIGGIFGESA